MLNASLAFTALFTVLISETKKDWWTYGLYAANGIVQSVGYLACFKIVS